MTLPEQIDGSNADQVRKSLLGVINHGATIVTAGTTMPRSWIMLVQTP